jgi:hypothetical protein
LFVAICFKRNTWLAMGKSGTKNKPTGNKGANAAERKAEAAQSALGIVAKNISAANADAILLIDRMLCELYMIHEWLEEFGFDSNQFVVLTDAFQQIKYFLTEVGPLATISAVEALHRFWLHNKAFPEGLSHEQYFTAAGLEALAKECFRTVQDAIAMSGGMSSSVSDGMSGIQSSGAGEAPSGGGSVGVGMSGGMSGETDEYMPSDGCFGPELNSTDEATSGSMSGGVLQIIRLGIPRLGTWRKQTH